MFDTSCLKVHEDFLGECQKFVNDRLAKPIYSMNFFALVLVLFFVNPYQDSDVSLKESRNKIFKLINAFRKENKLNEVEYVHWRQAEINLWARHLEKRFEHANGRFACENIAVNFDDPEEIFDQWKNSPGHRRNMLLPNIKYCAIGLHKGKYQNNDGAFFGVFRGYDGKLSAVKAR